MSKIKNNVELKEMKECQYFNYSSIFSGVGCGTFCWLGFFKVIPWLPCIAGIILFFVGALAALSDKLYWQKVPIIMEKELNDEYEPYIATIKNNANKNLTKSSNSSSLIEVINTLLKNLPLKSFSPGQTLIFLVGILLLFFILGVMLIQAIYDIHVFTQKDLRLGAIVVGFILLLYTLIYAIGEILGIKLLNSKKRL